MGWVVSFVKIYTRNRYSYGMDICIYVGRHGMDRYTSMDIACMCYRATGNSCRNIRVHVHAWMGLYIQMGI